MQAQGKSSKYRFAIGSSVHLARRGFTRFAVQGPFEVLALLPERDGQLQYRIKSSAEPYHRVAREDELEPE